MIDFEAGELFQDGVVATAMVGFAAGARTGTAAEMDGQFGAFDAFDDLIVHIDGEVGGFFGVVVLLAHIRIDEEAEVWVIDLNDRDAFVAKQLDLAAKDGNTGANEILSLGIGLG